MNRASSSPSRLWYLGLAVVAGCTASASCGGKLDHGKLEAQIVSTIKEQTGLEAKASCPHDHKVKQGDVFHCDVMLDGAPGKVTVTQNDGKGNVTWNLTEGFVLSDKVEGAIKTKLADVAQGQVRVDCGQRVRSAVPAQVFRCQAKDDAGELAIDVTITDATGAIDWKAAPPPPQ